MDLRCLFVLSHLLLAEPSEPPALQEPGSFRCEPAEVRLALKAPGNPRYGVVVETRRGKFLVTNLAYDPKDRRPMASWYLIWGPAGWGPYRSGFEGHLGLHGKVEDASLHPVWRENHFNAWGTPKDSPAGKAGLDVTDRLFGIDRVDGSTFDWSPTFLTYYITQRPSIEVEAVKLPVFFGPSRTRRTVVNQRLERAPDPADAELLPVQIRSEEMKAVAGRREIWVHLLQLRSREGIHRPLAFEVEGRKLWAVLSPEPLPADPKAPVSLGIEVWATNPQEGAFDRGLVALIRGSAEGPRVGSLVEIDGRWYGLQDWARHPESGALARFELRPWQPDLQALLGGARVSGVERVGASQREALEQAANEALLAYKTLTLPKELDGLDEEALGQRVLRIEKGLLALDLEVKGIRSRLDAAARVQAEWKAQAELAAKASRNPPPPPEPCPDTERLGDVLDQRKAILMAILNSLKQALAQVRR